ncbi:hypothetical protein HW555_010372 [Spodoptera exigua]|uniref:Uncharacterized protein n=1 Tax=Spodoptera exigua TaxID=7107 RepID=A0A835GBB5_SPOEX|nr:hypothetical protein HW555_010372 [Spodoptera exigua]
MNNIKLTKCILISISIILMWNIIALNCDNNVERYQEILDDLPKDSDLEHYLTILERAVDFCVDNKFDVDINLDFGLFLTGVSLKQVLREKGQELPPEIVFRLEQLLLMYDEVKEIFNNDKDIISGIGMKSQLSYLIYNISAWPVPLEKFNLELLKRTNTYDENQLKEIYGQWETYINTITDYYNFNPPIEDSDQCVARLAFLPAYTQTRKPQTRCRLPAFCIKYSLEGDDFGYGLAHRLLLFIMAKYSRNCAVFAENVDKYKMGGFCSMLYVECQYIALNNFGMPDLFLEIIALCGLLGHAQFLTNSWMEILTACQTPDGYFNGNIIGFEHSLNLKQKELMQHTTGVAVAAVANVIRYIAETHY